MCLKFSAKPFVCDHEPRGNQRGCPVPRLSAAHENIPPRVAKPCAHTTKRANEVGLSYLVLPTVSFPTMTSLSGRVTKVVPLLNMASKNFLTAGIPSATNASGGCSHGFGERCNPIPTLSSMSRRAANAAGRVPGKRQHTVARNVKSGDQQPRSVVHPTRLTPLRQQVTYPLCMFSAEGLGHLTEDFYGNLLGAD